MCTKWNAYVNKINVYEITNFIVLFTCMNMQMKFAIFKNLQSIFQVI